MMKLEAGSMAYAFLMTLLNQEDTHTIRLMERADGIAIKRNGGVWSPTLSCEMNPQQQPEQPLSVLVTDEGGNPWQSH